jgi:hypothetical protein
VRAFITFEEGEGYNLACSLTSKGNWMDKGTYLQILDSPIRFKPAPEPSNINWLR